MLELLEEYLIDSECECFAGGYTPYHDGSEMTFVNACIELKVSFCVFSQTIRIIDIRIDESQQNCGLGTEAVRAICCFAKKERLDVYAENVEPEAEHFWQEYAGFQSDPHNPDGFLYQTRETAHATYA